MDNRFLDHIRVIDPTLHGYIRCMAWAQSFPHGRCHRRSPSRLGEVRIFCKVPSFLNVPIPCGEPGCYQYDQRALTSKPVLLDSLIRQYDLAQVFVFVKHALFCPSMFYCFVIVPSVGESSVPTYVPLHIMPELASITTSSLEVHGFRGHIQVTPLSETIALLPRRPQPIPY